MAGHAHSPHYRAREQALTDGPGTTVPSLRAVRRITARKCMTGHNAFEPAALGHANGINVISGSKHRRSQNITWLHFFRKITKFLDSFDGNSIEFFDVAQVGDLSS